MSPSLGSTSLSPGPSRVTFHLIITCHRWSYCIPKGKCALFHAPLGVLCPYLPIVFHQCRLFVGVDVMGVVYHRVEVPELQELSGGKKKLGGFWGQRGIT